MQGYLVSAQVPFWLSIICICSVPQDFYSGGPISSLKALQVRKQKGIFPVNILWATPGKGNQRLLLPVFIQILGANNVIFYSSKNSWGPWENRIGNVTGLKNLPLRTQFCQTSILSGLEISFTPLASNEMLGLALAWQLENVADWFPPTQRKHTPQSFLSWFSYFWLQCNYHSGASAGPSFPSDPK